MPSWLLTPGPVLLKNYYRTSKYQPIVNEVELIDANPHYAKIRHQDGSEANVSIKDLAPAGQDITKNFSDNQFDINCDNMSDKSKIDFKDDNMSAQSTPPDSSLVSERELSNNLSTPNRKDILVEPPVETVVRRSERVRRPPDRLQLGGGD